MHRPTERARNAEGTQREATRTEDYERYKVRIRADVDPAERDELHDEHDADTPHRPYRSLLSPHAREVPIRELSG